MNGEDIRTGTPARSLPVIEAELEFLKQGIRQKEESLLHDYIEVGRRLEEAKAQLHHGEWGGWLEKMDIRQSTANNFMRLFKEYGADQQSLFGGVAKSQALGNLTYTKAVLLLAVPAEEREEFAAEHNVEAMSTRELREAIKERDEAIKQAEQARADAKAAEDARTKMEADMSAANSLLESARAESAATAKRESELRAELEALKTAPVEVAVMEVDQSAIDQARAEAVAEMQAQLDKAKAAKAKSEEKRKDAEAAVEILKMQLEEAAKAQQQAVAMADPDVAKFEVYFNQAQESANKLHGLLIKARGREDQTTADKLTKAILALAEQMRGYAG